MNKKLLQIIIVLVIGIVAGFLGGYLFKQSSKIKEVSKRTEVLKQEHTGKNKTVVKKEVEDKGPIFNKKLVIEPKKEETQIQSPKTEESTYDVIKKWVDEYIITPYFIEDLVKYILNSYYPPNTVYNKGQKPLLNISLKSLNARYGLELIGFRIEGYSVEKAREKIITTILDPQLLKKQYEKYCNIFIDELIDQAKDTKKDFIINGKIEKRELTNDEIKILLISLANYINDVSKILDIISKDKDFTDKLDRFLKIEEIAMHKNYILNQVLNEYRKEKLKTLTDKSTDKSDNPKIKELEVKKDIAVRDYQIYLKKREMLRGSIIESILKNAPTLSLDSSEILYISEWVYRRIKQGYSFKDIKNVAEILKLAGSKLRQRANEIN